MIAMTKLLTTTTMLLAMLAPAHAVLGLDGIDRSGIYVCKDGTQVGVFHGLTIQRVGEKPQSVLYSMDGIYIEGTVMTLRFEGGYFRYTGVLARNGAPAILGFGDNYWMPCSQQ
jgi:hypothetical protein